MFIKMTDLPQLGFTGLEAGLTEEELLIQKTAHRFAEEVMRPIGEQLDKMSAEEAIASDSPLFSYYQQIQETGLLDLDTMATLSDEQKSRLLPIIFEELAWGDCGLSLMSMVAGFPAYAALLTGDKSLIKQFDGRIGCWLATQPDRGGDVVDSDGHEIHSGSRQTKPNIHARIDGNEVIVTGQSSAWVSAAPIAETAFCFIPCDYGDGLYNDDGTLPHISLLIDLDDPKVTKGKPLEKLGMRSLPQGEIFFDEVRVPMKNVLARGQQAVDSFMGTLTFANMEMGLSFTGVARAAYEHALEYVHERKQGGSELINHQSVRMRLFDIWSKVETCRAMAHRATNFNFGPNGPHLLASVTSKTFVTQNSYEAVSESLQLFGGNGLTKEYPLEKLFRDARAALIADGENYLLSLKGASWISRQYRHEKGE